MLQRLLIVQKSLLQMHLRLYEKGKLKKKNQNKNKKQATGDLINNKIAKLQVLHQLNQNC